MNEGCRHEPHVLRAAAEDRWSEALRAHVMECADCAAAASVAPFLSRFSRLEERRPRLPDPSVVWLKAQLLGSIAVAERITRPLNIFQMVAYVAVAGGWAAMLMWKWADLQQWALSFTPSHVVEGMAGGHGAVSGTVMAAAVVLGSMTVMLGLHTILAEE